VHKTKQTSICFYFLQANSNLPHMKPANMEMTILYKETSTTKIKYSRNSIFDLQ